MTRVDGLGQPMFEDEPLLDRGADLLSRVEYADRVAEVIIQLSQRSTSTVLAIVGPWGSGKTTLLNFVLEKMDDDLVRVVKFNPWMVSSLPSLVADFFATLLSALPNRRRIRKGVATLARAVSPLASAIDIPALDLGRGLQSVASQLNEGGSSALQRRVEKQLKKVDRPILVVLDDIDRLHTEELLMVFKLVRLVGRLPNVYYLLAYDEATVLGLIKSTTLAGNNMDRAHRYLEKMVQVRLVVPPVNESARTRLLDRLLSDILTRYGVELDYVSQQRLAGVYQDYLRLDLREPRQLKRYCGQIEAHYPLVQHEVDFMDFALVMYLHMFHSAIADLLPVYKAELTGTDSTQLVQEPDAETLADRWRGRLVRAGVEQHELDRILDLLAHLFPPIAAAIGRPGFPGYGGTSDRGVWSSDYFNRYFQLGFGSDDLPDSVVSEALYERLGTGPGPAWSRVLSFMPADTGLVLRKIRAVVRAEGHNTERILRVLCDLAVHVPVASNATGNAESMLANMVAELLIEVTPRSAQVFIEDLARRSSVRFVATAAAWGKELLARQRQAPSPSFDDICGAATALVIGQLDRQARLHPRETEDVFNLLGAWADLDPSANRRGWLLTHLGEGKAWNPVDFAALLVPEATTVGTGRQWLDDFNFSLLEELIGVDVFTALIGNPATDPVYVVDDPSPEDMSFEARRARALRALTRRASDQTS